MRSIKVRKTVYIALISLILASVFLLISTSYFEYETRSDSERVVPSSSPSIVGDYNVIEGLDPQLSGVLNKEGIVKAFAWRLLDTNTGLGEVVAFDQAGRLRRVRFGRTDGAYQIESNSPYSSNEIENQEIKTSGSINLNDYIGESDSPFKAYVISTGGCNTHFILAHRALNKSLAFFDGPLVDVVLRIIVERDSKVVSNILEDPEIPRLDQVLVQDINGDETKEFVFMGEDRSKSLFIWTVGDDCSVAPVQFKDGDEEFDSLGGDVVRLEQDVSKKVFKIHSIAYDSLVQDGQSFWHVIDFTYEWSEKERVYKRTKKTEELQKKQ